MIGRATTNVKRDSTHQKISTFQILTQSRKGRRLHQNGVVTADVPR